MNYPNFSLLEQIFYWILALLFPFAIFMAWRRSKVEKRKFALVRHQSDEPPVIGTEEDLRRAEEEVAASPLNPREQLLEDHVLHSRYSTLRGFSEPYMIDLVNALEQEGIYCTYLFQETLPLGYGSVFNRHGVFELYVPREQVEEAERFIKQWRGRPTTH